MKKQIIRNVGVTLSMFLVVNSLSSVMYANTSNDAYKPKTHVLKANSETVRWGNIGKGDPALTVHSGDIVTVEVITHHSGDDYERMIKGDAGVEDIFHWIEGRRTKRSAGRRTYYDGSHRSRRC